VPARVSGDWVAVASERSAIVPEMYRELLARHGIPAVVYGAALSSGALGGIPTSVRLLVPADRVAAARTLLDAAQMDGVDGADPATPDR
jgi:hypothetical protein